MRFSSTLLYLAAVIVASQAMPVQPIVIHRRGCAHIADGVLAERGYVAEDVTQDGPIIGHTHVRADGVKRDGPIIGHTHGTDEGDVKRDGPIIGHTHVRADDLKRDGPIIVHTHGTEDEKRDGPIIGHTHSSERAEA